MTAKKPESVISSQSMQVPASVYVNKLVHGLFAIVFLYFALLFSVRRFYAPTSVTKTSSNDELQLSIQRFVLFFQWLPVAVLPLCIAIYRVLNVRVSSLAIDPMSGYEHLVTMTTKQLTNTLEQFVLLFASQAGIVARLPVNLLQVLIPFSSIAFLITRICFFVGYPHQRAFGFLSSFVISNCFVLLALAHSMDNQTIEQGIRAFFAHFQ